MFWLLLAVYIGLMAIGVIWSISLAWRSGALWGIGTLLLWVPVYFPCYVIYNYREAWKPLVVVVIAMYIGYAHVGPRIDMDKVGDRLASATGQGHAGLDTERAMREADAAMLRDGAEATGVYSDRRKALDRAMQEGRTGDDYQQVPVYEPGAMGSGYSEEELAFAQSAPDSEVLPEQEESAEPAPRLEKREITLNELAEYVGKRMEVTNTSGRTFDVILESFENDMAVFQRQVGQGSFALKLHRRKIRKVMAWLETGSTGQEDKANAE